MTLQEARDTGRNAVMRFGKPYLIYRFPAWPADVYGLHPAGKLDQGLPKEAEIVETLVAETPTKKPASSGQGSLF